MAKLNNSSGQIKISPKKKSKLSSSHFKRPTTKGKVKAFSKRKSKKAPTTSKPTTIKKQPTKVKEATPSDTVMPRVLKQRAQAINRQLAKLESTPYDKNDLSAGNLAKYSAQYRWMQTYYARQSPNPDSENAKASAAIYKSPSNDPLQTKVRLKATDKEWAEMSEAEKKKLEEVVEHIWEKELTGETSLIAPNIYETYNKAYDSFLKNHNLTTEDLSEAEYASMWQTVDQLRTQKNDHYGSEQIIQLLESHDVKHLITDNQLKEAIRYKEAGRIAEFDRKNPGYRTWNL